MQWCRDKGYCYTTVPHFTLFLRYVSIIGQYFKHALFCCRKMGHTIDHDLHLLVFQWHHEQQGFLPASQPNESAGHARDCHGGHGQCAGRRQVTGMKAWPHIDIFRVGVVITTHCCQVVTVMQVNKWQTIKSQGPLTVHSYCPYWLQSLRFKQ